MKSAKFLAAPGLRGGELKCVVATLLTTILVLQTSLAASGPVIPKSAPVEQSAKATAMKQKVLKVQPQSIVVVKLKNNEQLQSRLSQPATPETGSCLEGSPAPVEQEVSQCAR